MAFTSNRECFTKQGKNSQLKTDTADERKQMEMKNYQENSSPSEKRHVGLD